MKKYTKTRLNIQRNQQELYVSDSYSTYNDIFVLFSTLIQSGNLNGHQLINNDLVLFCKMKEK